MWMQTMGHVKEPGRYRLVGDKGSGVTLKTEANPVGCTAWVGWDNGHLGVEAVGAQRNYVHY